MSINSDIPFLECSNIPMSENSRTLLTDILTKCTAQEAKSPVKKSRQAALRGGI
jgi:hypothetical protein